MSDQEQPRAFHIPAEFLADPALYVNVTVPVLMLDGNVKIVLGETMGTGGLEPRGSYVLTSERAFGLAQGLMQCVEGATQIRQATEEARKGMN